MVFNTPTDLGEMVVRCPHCGFTARATAALVAARDVVRCPKCGAAVERADETPEPDVIAKGDG